MGEVGLGAPPNQMQAARFLAEDLSGPAMNQLLNVTHKRRHWYQVLPLRRPGT